MRRGRSLGSAHAGTGEWMLQRLTALYLALFLIVAALAFLTHPDQDYAHWAHFWSRPLVRLAALLFGFGLIGHAWVGLRSVVRDYVQAPGVRFLAELVLATALVAEGLWCVRVFWV